MFKPTHCAVANLKGLIRIGQDLQHVYDDWYIDEGGGVLRIAKHNLCKLKDVEEVGMMFKPTHCAVANLKGLIRIGQDLQHVYDD